MAKILKPTRNDKCTGCEMCVFEAQRQLKKIGLEESLIRVFRGKDEDTGAVTFDIEIDPRSNVLDAEKIVSICPREVLEVIEQ
jgi:NAD-dependent dihydropyrimidine dehydrogenase PreA subunit